jgi:hypothetical protein
MAPSSPTPSSIHAPDPTATPGSGPAATTDGWETPVTYAASADGQRAMATVTADSVAQAVAAAVALDRSPWALGLIFASSPETLAEAGVQLRAQLPSLKVAGCTAAGIVNRQTRVGAAVQITLLGGPGIVASVAVASLDSLGSREAGQRAGHAVSQLPAMHHAQTALILLADGLAGDTNHIVRGAYEVAGATVPIVGGCAGDDLAMAATYQLAGDQLVTRSVVGVALSSSGPLGMGVRHGWNPVGSPMTVTAADGTSILSLDDRPALDAYLEALGSPETGQTRAELAQFCQTRPLGLESRGGHHVRFVRGADVERRSVEFLVAIGEGELVTLMQGGSDTVVAAAGSAVEDAVAQLDGPPLGIVAFDCVACRGVIGDDQLNREIDAVSRHLPDGAALAGLYTYGEIARRGGGLGFHNQTMVVLAIQ